MNSQEGNNIVQRQLTSVGCTYTEYRGVTPPDHANLHTSPGDIYFDIGEWPYHVWVSLGNEGWMEWFSMAHGKECPHPIMNCIIFLTALCLGWLPTSGCDNYYSQMKL
jgi:hypothetical protein